MLRQLVALGSRALVAQDLRYRAASATRSFSAGRRAIPAQAISAPIRRPSEALPWGQPGQLQPALGPSLWSLYLQQLEHRPLVTKALTSFAMTVLSDSVAQLLGGVAGYSLWRCMRMGLYSASVGALSGHYWHRFLDATCCPEQPKSAKAVGSKLALDQLLFTPVMTCAFLAFLKAADGQPHMVLPFVQDKLGSTLLAGYAVWPAVNLITFRYIPQDLRILFGSAVGLFWGVYMSLSCVNAAHTCPEPGMHISGVVEGATGLQVLEN